MLLLLIGIKCSTKLFIKLVPLILQIVCKWSFKDTNIPSSSQIEHTIRNVRNSTPGVDGLPAAAWLSEAGVVTLFHLQCNIFCGIHQPICFNDACIVCPPKKVPEQVGLPVYREAHEARPLKINNPITRLLQKLRTNKVTASRTGRRFLSSVVSRKTDKSC